jgi:hypothetical protein
MTKERKAWIAAKANAKRRGIGFTLSFDDFITWWICELGPDWLKLKGRKSHQFQMARFNDRGIYKLGNIQCITAAQNRAEQKMILGNTPWLGRKHSEETKAKMSTNNSRYWSGVTLSRKVRSKISKSLKGRVFTDQHRENLRLSRIKRKAQGYGYSI